MNWTPPTIQSVFPKPAYTAVTGPDCLDRLDELTREEKWDCWLEQGKPEGGSWND